MPQRLALLNIVGLTPNLLGDATPNLVDFARRCGGIRSLIPDLPAVTCTVQSSILTGTTPAQHGIVGNGWFDRTQNEVQFWKQRASPRPQRSRGVVRSLARRLKSSSILRSSRGASRRVRGAS